MQGGTFYLTADCPLTTDRTSSWNGSDLASDPGVVFTKTGDAELRVFNGDASGFQGQFKIEDGAIRFNYDHGTQYQFLGSNPLIVSPKDTSTNVSLSFSHNSDKLVNDVPTPIRFDTSGGDFSNNYFSIGLPGSAGDTPGDYVINFNGQFTSDSDLGGKTNLGAIFFYQGAVYDDRPQAWLNADNSGLTFTPVAALWDPKVFARSANLVLNNPHALGADNGAYTYMRELNIANRPGTRHSVRATDGNDVTADFRFGTSGSSNVAELGIQGAGEVEFSGDVYMDDASDLNGKSDNQMLTLYAPTGGKATLSGVIQDNGSDDFRSPVVKLGAGEVALTGANTYEGDTQVRVGTLLVGNADALGASTDDVLLGGDVPSAIEVAAASIENVGGYSGGVYTSPPAEIDGVTLAAGDTVLVRSNGNSAHEHGVFEVQGDGTWTRIAAMDEESEIVFGTRVEVAGGNLFGGSSFFVANRHGMEAGMLETPGSSSDPKGWLGFTEEYASNPDVALLTEGAMTVARNITVTDNKSDGTVDFSGDIAGGFGVTKTGAGEVTFSTDKSYTGATSVDEGTLNVNATLSATSQVDVNAGGALGGTGTIDAAINVNAGGTLAMGESPGVLTANDAVTLASTAIFEVELEGLVAGAEHDQLSVTSGDVELGGSTLAVTHTDFATSGDAYLWLIDNSGAGALNGQFDGLAGGDVAATIDGRDFFVYYGADLATQSLDGGNDLLLSTIGQAVLLGDFDGNGAVNGLDIPGFKDALADPDAWAAANPGMPHPDDLGDFDGNGAFNGLDIPGFKDTLAGSAVPEPLTLSLVAAGMALALRRRR